MHLTAQPACESACVVTTQLCLALYAWLQKVLETGSVSGAVEENEADSAKEEKQKDTLSGGPSQQAVGKVQSKQRTLKRRNTWSGTDTPFADILSTKPDPANHNLKHVGSRGFRPKPHTAPPP